MSGLGLFRGRLGFGQCVGLILVVSFIGQGAKAQLPHTFFESVFPPAAKPGQSVEVKVAGRDIDDVNQLTFSHPGITAKQKMAEPGPFDKTPRPVPNEFVVTLAANVPPGCYEARIQGKYGISNPRLFVVSTLTEAVESEPNNSRDSATELKVPQAVSGQSNARADVDWFKFAANSGQRILVDCFARRIDSKMEPVVTVYTASGRELGISRADRDSDPLVDFVTPATGDYFIRVVDALYRPTGQGNDNRYQQYSYRLTVGVLPHIDFIFPAAGQAGGNRPFTVFGRNLPGGQPAGISVDGKPLQKLNVSIPLPAGAALENLVYDGFLAPEAAGLDGVAYRVNTPQGRSNQVLVGIATAPIVLEKEPNNTSDKSQVLTLPVEVQGQFFPRGDVDWYQFEAKQGDVYEMKVISQQLGYPTDPNLLIQQVTMVTKKDADGKEVMEERVKTLARADDSGNYGGGVEFDTRTDDPEYRFTVPADGTYRVLVRDAQSALRNDPRHVYRLAITKGQPDFRLVASPGHNLGALLLRKNGKARIRVIAFRRDGFDGDIQLAISGLPAGVTAAPATIGSGRSSTAIVLVAAANAGPASGLIQITGTSKIGAANATRKARFGTATWPQAAANQPLQTNVGRLSTRLVVSISAVETDPVSIDIGEGNKIYETSRAGIVKIPYKRVGTIKPQKVTANADGLPANIDFNAKKALGIGDSGTFELKLNTNTLPGTYTFHLVGTAEKVKYARNPEAAKAAAARKTEVDKINADTQAAAKAAAAEKAKADKAATDMAAAEKAAINKKTAADQALVQVQTAAKTAVTNAAQAKNAAAKAPADKNLATASQNAAKMATDADTKVKTATAAVVAAQKVVDDANAKSKTATDTKAATDKKNEEAQALAKAATELKAKTDKRKTDTENAAKPKDVNVPTFSNTVTIKVIAIPVTLAATQPGGPLKQGAKLEVPVTIARLQGYNQPVTISVVLPGGVSGISIGNATIAANQTAGKLALTAAANATPGTHNLTVRATLKLNNQNLTVDQSITLIIQKVEPPKK